MRYIKAKRIPHQNKEYDEGSAKKLGGPGQFGLVVSVLVHGLKGLGFDSWSKDMYFGYRFHPRSGSRNREQSMSLSHIAISFSLSYLLSSLTLSLKTNGKKYPWARKKKKPR